MIACNMCGTQVEVGMLLCPQCGAKVVHHESAPVEKAAMVKFLAPWGIRLIIGGIALVGIWSFYQDAFREYHPVISKQPDIAGPGPAEKTASTLIAARMEGPFLIVSLSEVRKDRIVRFYDPDGVQKIPVLAYVSSGGKVVTAMSVSENCRSQDFYLEGENIHCASCPSYWNASSLEAYACCQKFYPDPIPSTVLGDELRIEVSAIRNWQARS